jgi:hypothetical protein
MVPAIKMRWLAIRESFMHWGDLKTMKSRKKACQEIVKQLDRLSAIYSYTDFAERSDVQSQDQAIIIV